jgi:SAM-dependent methyltransferase
MPYLPVTPVEALGELVRDAVIVDGHSFLIERPRDSDRLLEHPVIRGAFDADEYLPYWADLWPASRMLAQAVLRENWPGRATALELGCGLGLPGVAALSRGLHVIFTDCDPTALRFAGDNARMNGFADFELLAMDWRRPPEGLEVPIVLGSDLIYERRHVEPVVGLIARILAPEGVCLLTDQDRPPASYLREVLTISGLDFQTETMRAGSPGGLRFKGTLYRIQKQGT